MSLRSSPRKRGPSTWPWIPAGVHPRESGGGNERVLLRLLRPVSAAPLLPRDQPQPEAARREANRRHHRAIGKARNDHAAAFAQTAISLARNLFGGAHEQPRQDAAHACARLQLLVVDEPIEVRSRAVGGIGRQGRSAYGLPGPASTSSQNAFAPRALRCVRPN